MRRRLLLLSALLAAGGALPAAARRHPPSAPAPAPVHVAPRPVGLLVFAAASLTEAMHDIGALWQAAGHPPVRFSFGSSGTLARQIQQGAPANLFISADEKWMDALQQSGDLAPGTRTDLLGNALVLVGRQAAAGPIGRGFDLAGLLKGGRLAVGDTARVPAGIYAAQALRWIGAWDAVKDRLAIAADVRGALRLVATGEAPAGIVYGTDVRAAPGIAVIGTFPPESHDPIRYPAAVVKQGDGTEARALLAFLQTQPALDVFRHYGFDLLGR